MLIGIALWQPRFGFTFGFQDSPRSHFGGHFGWFVKLEDSLNLAAESLLASQIMSNTVIFCDNVTF